MVLPRKLTWIRLVVVVQWYNSLVELCVLEIMNDVRARASRLKSSDEQLRPMEYDVTQEECDILWHVETCRFTYSWPFCEESAYFH